MNKKIFTGVLFALGVFIATTFSAYAEIPPPPVNQNLAIPDTVFNNLQEADCRFCHNQNPPIDLVDNTYLPDRHHLLVDMTIPPNSQAPNGDPNGDGLYECLSCHTEVWNPVTFSFEFAPFRDCALCHSQQAGAPTVHHATAAAQAGDCQACHGSFVDNGLLDDDNDGILNSVDDDDAVTPTNGWIPSYQPSLVTPWPSGKPNGGEGASIKDGGDFGAGNCNFCHNTVALPGVDPTPTVDPASGILVFRNSDTHHSTGFVLDSTKCAWCHFQADPTAVPVSIRTCENCHGIPSVHNIQLGLDRSDTGPGVTPGLEPAYNGHIGAQQDCWGCHGNNGQILSAPSSGPVIPFIDGMSVSSFVEGAASPLAITGEGFINTIQNPTTGAYDIRLDCDVKLIDANGNEIILEPVSVTPTQIDVMITPDIAAGTYKLMAVKGPRASNPKVICITEPVEISSAFCSAGVVTISGNGFSNYADATNSGTSVSSGNKTATIVSWASDEIVANFGGSCVPDLTVATLFGEASTAVENDGSSAAVVPVIDSINRTSGRTGYTRRIYGENFGDGTNGKVMFGSVEAPIRSWSDTMIKFRVPSVSRGTYDVAVEVDGQLSNAISFRKR